MLARQAVAQRCHDQQSASSGLAGDKLEQAQGRDIGPVQVLEHQQQRLGRSGTLPHLTDRIEQAKACLSRIGQRWRRRQSGKPFPQLRKDLCDAVCAMAQCVAKRLVTLGLRKAAKDLHPGPVRGRAELFVTLPPQHQRAALTSDRGKCAGGAGFADAGLARQQSDLTSPQARAVERRTQCGELIFPTDNARHRSRRRHVVSPGTRAHRCAHGIEVPAYLVPAD